MSVLPAKRACACDAGRERPALPNRLCASSDGIPHDVTAANPQVVLPDKNSAAARRLLCCLLSASTEDRRTGLQRKGCSGRFLVQRIDRTGLEKQSGPLGITGAYRVTGEARALQAGVASGGWTCCNFCCFQLLRQDRWSLCARDDAPTA